MARLHLLRHGETDWNAEQRWQGHSDRPLNDLGREQAVAIAPAVAALRPVAMHASDLVRAIDTARPAAALCRLEVIIDPLLAIELPHASYVFESVTFSDASVRLRVSPRASKW